MEKRLDIPILMEQISHVFPNSPENTENRELQKQHVVQDLNRQSIELFLEYCTKGTHDNVAILLQSNPCIAFSEQFIALGYLIVSVKQFETICQLLLPMLSKEHYDCIVNMLIEHMDIKKMEKYEFIWFLDEEDRSKSTTNKRMKPSPDEKLISKFIRPVYEDDCMNHTIALIDRIHGFHKEVFHTESVYKCLCDNALKGLGISLFRNVIFQMISDNEFPEQVLSNLTFIDYVCQSNLLNLAKLIYEKNKDGFKCLDDQTIMNWFDWDDYLIMNFETFQWIMEHNVMKLSNRRMIFLTTYFCEYLVNKTQYKEHFVFLINHYHLTNHSLLRRLFMNAIINLNYEMTLLLFEYNPNVKEMLIDANEQEGWQLNEPFHHLASLQGYNWEEDCYSQEGALERLFNEMIPILHWLGDKVNTANITTHDFLIIRYDYVLTKEQKKLSCKYSIMCTLKTEKASHDTPESPELEACMICYEHTDKCVLNFNHPFCKSCLLKLFETNHVSCPYCSTKIQTIHEVTTLPETTPL